LAVGSGAPVTLPASIKAAGSGGGDHHFFNDHATDEIFGGSNVLHAFSNGPAIGSRFQVPLSWREIVAGVEDHLFAGFEQLKGLFFVGLSEFLERGRRPGTAEKQQERGAPICERRSHFSPVRMRIPRLLRKPGDRSHPWRDLQCA
jgi:hypothetical protein